MIKTYLKINNLTYPATFSGKMNDVEWDNRQSKIIHLTMSYQVAKDIFKDGITWSILEVIENEVPTFDEEGNPAGTTIQTIEKEYDNSEFSILGPITAYPTGELKVKMGKMTDLEEAYELLYGGIM